MSPLICVQQSLDDAAEFEEVFFLNTGMLDRLNYVGLLGPALRREGIELPSV